MRIVKLLKDFGKYFKNKINSLIHQSITDAVPWSQPERQICAGNKFVFVFIAESVGIEFFWIWVVIRIVLNTVNGNPNRNTLLEEEFFIDIVFTYIVFHAHAICKRIDGPLSQAFADHLI